MKRFFFLALLALLCGGLWGADFSLSAGAGGLFGGFFTRYSAENSSGSSKMTQEANQLNYGGLLFFDAAYAELALILQGGTNSYSDEESGDPLRTGDGWETMLGLSLLGKYPFTLTEKISLFPLLGVEYQIALSERRRPSGGIIHDRTDGILEEDKNGNAYDLSAWNSLWINLGVGTDFVIVNDFFVRGELLYGFRLMTPYEKDSLEANKSILGDDPDIGGLTSGPSLRLSVGYRFRNL